MFDKMMVRSSLTVAFWMSGGILILLGHPWEAVSASFFSLGGMEGNNSLSSFELYFIGDNE